MTYKAQIRPLTADADDLIGGANNDTFYAPLSVAGVQTLQTFDRIDGGEGTNTLKATINNADFNAANVLSAVVSNIQNFDLRTLSAQTVDFSGVTAVEKIQADRILNSLTVDNVENVVTLGAIRGEDSAPGTQSIFNVEYAAGVVEDNVNSRGRFTQEFALNNANVALDVAAGGASELTSATYNINLTGSSTVALASTLSNALAETGTLDTITTTGAGSIDLDLGALTGDLTVKLGAGNDTLRLDGTDLDANDKIDLGAGNNTLVMSGFNGTVGKELSSMDLTGVKGADALAFSDAYTLSADDTLDLGNRGEVTFLGAVDGAGTEVLTVETTSADLAVNFADDAGATGFGLEVSSEVANLTLNVGTAVAGADLTLASLTNAADDNSDTKSLKTLTLVNERDDSETGQTFDITLGGANELNGLKTIDLSAAGQQEANYVTGASTTTDEVTLDASTAAFSGPVTIKIGEAELNYTNANNNLREIFKFTSEKISDITISAFTVTSAGNGDKLDFSQIAGISSLDDLSIDEISNGVFEIGAADGQFAGTIELNLAGVNTAQDILEANAFIF